MAISRSDSGLDDVFYARHTFFHQNMAQTRKVQVKRRVYRATFHELSVLFDRALVALGIARSCIKKLSWEAAYGI